ncbi:MAG: 3'-5' exonuclease, partial [Bacteroidota bacterium]
LDAFKRQHNLVHISEFNSRISRIVMSEPVPFIYERLGEKYHHVLIDEFQDTSRLQWLNLVPLVENALAGGYFNLVVGDGKQAIYRWRNGDVTQFTSLPALPDRDRNPLIRQRELLFSRYFTEHRLESNFRSFPGIIDFNNRFFHWLSQHLEQRLQEVYRDLVQKPHPGRKGGYISLEFLTGEDPDLTYTDGTINRTEEIVRRLLEHGFALEDMAILCRTNRQAARIARELILRGIDVVSSESLLLSYSQEVRFITGWIRFLFNPANTILQASIASFLQVRGMLPKETNGLHALLSEIGLAEHPGDTLLNILQRNGWRVNQDQLLSLPVYDLCETVIRTFGLNRRADPYIQFFLDAVIAFSEKEEHSAADFLEWWDQQQNRFSIVVPEALDAVKIMTIHKAKGLEFRVVIFPFADESLRKTTKDYLWVELPPGDKPGLKTAFLPARKKMLETPFADQFREEQERTMLDLVNLLYVVMTRAKEQLYVLSAPPPVNALELKSLPVIFATYLKETGVWEEGKNHYEFGTLTGGQQTTGKMGDQVRSLTSLPSCDWRPAIRIRHRAPEYWDMEDLSGRADFGNRVHALLAGINTAGDLEEAMKRALLSGAIAAEEEKRICQVASNVLKHPHLERFFSAEVAIRTEPEIMERNGETSRPDRVVFDGEEVAVIDYKTGKRSDSHRKQMERYARLLEEMGYHNVRKLLVYLGDEVEVVEI